jgi:hypothetical protein
MSRGTHNGRGPRSGETRRGLRPRRLGRGIRHVAANAGTVRTDGLPSGLMASLSTGETSDTFGKCRAVKAGRPGAARL